MEEKIIDIINQIRPYLNSDGGNIEFIKYENNIVYIKLTGACGCCQFKNDTINDGILRTIQKKIPTVVNVISIDI